MRIKITILVMVMLTMSIFIESFSTKENDHTAISQFQSFGQVDQDVINWDQDHWLALEDIKNQKEDFRIAVKHYKKQIDHKLSKKELRHVIKESNRHDIPVGIMLKLLKVESNFNKDLVGPPTKYGQAYGMAQFMTNTAPWISEMANLDYDFELLFDPYYSITLAATYLHYLQYGDNHSHMGYKDWHTSLTAYNRGMGGLRQYQQKHNTSISSYSEKIINQANAIALHQ